MKTNGIMKRICIGFAMVLITLSLSVSLSMSVSAQGRFKDVRQTYLWDVEGHRVHHRRADGDRGNPLPRHAVLRGMA